MTHWDTHSRITEKIERSGIAGLNGGLLVATQVGTKPIVYTLTTCPACVVMKEDWNKQGIEFEERQVDESQSWLDEARTYGDVVPIVVYPDGKVTMGYKDMISCNIG